MTNNAFYKYVESRGQAGYKCAILVKENVGTEGSPLYKYVMLLASETVPSVFGTQDSFEFDLLNSASKGKVAGKTSLEDKEVEFLNHRDNIIRLEGLKNKMLDFMFVTPDLMGWHFVGTIKVRPNDASAEVLKGTYTITPMSADENALLNVRDMIYETVAFTDEVPDSIDDLSDTGEAVSCPTDPSDATLTCVVYDFTDGVKGSSVSTNIEGTVASNVVTLKQKTGATVGTHYGIAYITANKAGMASWTTTIAVSTTKAGT